MALHYSPESLGVIAGNLSRLLERVPDGVYEDPDAELFYRNIASFDMHVTGLIRADRTGQALRAAGFIDVAAAI